MEKEHTKENQNVVSEASITEEKPMEKENVAESKSATSGMPKILIAEDEKPMAKAMSLKLRKEGFEVVVVHNGEEAIEKIKEGGFALVLLDLIMPKVDGFEVLEQTRDLPNRPPIIVSSNLGQEEDKMKANEYDAAGFLVKSETPLAVLVEIVKNSLSLEEKQ